jgi:serine/threonine protein kinase
MDLSINPKPKKGQKYGCWTLKKPIGEGGNGFVFLAHDGNGHEVAIKILAKLEGKSKKVYERFKREVKIIQENSDIKGVMPILDSFLPCDSSKDFPWYVMPVAQPLESFITSKSVEAKVLAVLEIGHTLTCLHQRGISHRDIKPANILVKDNIYYLVDFGLASIEDGIDLTT